MSRPPDAHSPAARETPSYHHQWATMGSNAPNQTCTNGLNGDHRGLRSLSGHSNPASEFAPDASIVLVGIRGSGKSTLGIMASAAMGRTVLDLENTFRQTTGGLSSAEYKSQHGATACQSRQAQILKTILTANSTSSIIIVSWLEKEIQLLLREYCVTNPVILVSRDAAAIQEHLKAQAIDRDKIATLVNASGAILRACTNFHFANLTEKPAPFASLGYEQVASDTTERDHGSSCSSDSDSDPAHHRSVVNVITRRSPLAPYLTLKRAERHFLKFLSLAMPPGSIPFIESAFPLATVPTESREYTYAVSIPLSTLLSSDFDVEEIETGADAVEIVVDDLRFLERGREASTSSSSLSPPRKLAAGFDFGRASEIARAVGNIRRMMVLPIVFHVATPGVIRRGGGSVGDDDNWWHGLYLDLIRHGFRLAAEFVTLDMGLDDSRIANFVTAKGHSKIIAHFESPTPTNTEIDDGNSWESPSWLSRYQRAENLGCDIVRFVRGPAATMNDNLSVDRLRTAIRRLGSDSERKVPLIAYNSGMLGRHSACFNRVLTPVATRVSLASSGPTSSDDVSFSVHQPRLTALEATQALYASFVYDPMKLYVFGANVSYSLSPAMHNTALAALGIPHHYSPVSTDSMAELDRLVRAPDCAGASIGLPFKVDVLKLTDALSPHAAAIGAANTVIPIRHHHLGPAGDSESSIPSDLGVLLSMGETNRRTGPVTALLGENTDWIGIRACIRRGLSPANAVRPSTCGLVIGAGGMARAAVYAMLQLGVRNIVIYNRTVSRAVDLVRHFEGVLAGGGLPTLGPRPDQAERGHDSAGSTRATTATPPTRFHVLQSLTDSWPSPAGIRSPTVIISCIPTHGFGPTEPAPEFVAPAEWLVSATGGVVIELGYKTLDTPLLRQSRAEAHRGWVTMDGLDLLPEQGFAQFELFTGRRAPRRLMRRAALRAAYEEHQKSQAAEKHHGSSGDVLDREMEGQGRPRRREMEEGEEEDRGRTTDDLRDRLRSIHDQEP